jgi:hypothetical protein
VTEFVIAALALAATVYGAAAGSKLRSARAYRSFRDGLAETGLVPRRLAIVAALLAASEAAVTALALTATVMTALSVGTRAVTVPAMAMAVLLTGVLAVGAATVIRRGTQAHCACFGAVGASDQPIGRVHLARNLALAGVLIAGFVGAALQRGRTGAATEVTAIAVGALAGLVLTRLDDLVSLFAPVPAPVFSAPRTRLAGSVAARLQHGVERPSSTDERRP